MAYEGGINYGNFSRRYTNYCDKDAYCKWNIPTTSTTASFPEEALLKLYNSHYDAPDAYSYFVNRLQDEITKLILYGEDGMKAEEIKKIFEPKHVLVNGDYTTVVWMDGDKTVVKRNPDEPYDFDKAIMYAMLKKIFDGNGSDMRRFLKQFEEKTTKKKK